MPQMSPMAWYLLPSMMIIFIYILNTISSIKISTKLNISPEIEKFKNNTSKKW